MSVDGFLEKLSPEVRDEIERRMEAKAASSLWFPNPGPQTMAFESEAEILYYGGQAGGGKSALMIGLALTAHRRSRIFRKQSVDLRGLEDELKKVIGPGAKGYNSQDKVYRGSGKDLELCHISNPGDEQSYQGRARDLMCFDEAVHFQEHEVSFVLGWLRSTDDVRCRAILGSNPPTDSEGEWIIKWFAPWVDPMWKGYEPGVGELGWAIHDSGNVYWVAWGKDYERKAYRIIDGEAVEQMTEVEFRALPRDQRRGLLVPRSYTFIPASLDDNPDLDDTNYRQTLMAMPEPVRSMMMFGDFKVAREDNPWQVIPTDWVKRAQERWSPEGRRGVPMSHLGVDVAQGGLDNTELARRHDWWFDEIIERSGDETPDGPSVSALVMLYVRDGAQINIDVGGGWGNHAFSLLKDAGQPVAGMLGSAKGIGNDRSGRLTFYNERAQQWWGFREALDPDHCMGLALPPDDDLLKDLTAPRWDEKHAARGIILIESKIDIRARIGRSPDKGDAVIYAYADKTPVNTSTKRQVRRGVVGGRTQRRKR